MSTTHKHSEYNGEPGCRTSDEINKMFRHFWDPTSYWQCEALDKPARKRNCPQSELFLDSKGCCVHYTEWRWTEPIEPPSHPKKS